MRLFLGKYGVLLLLLPIPALCSGLERELVAAEPAGIQSAHLQSAHPQTVVDPDVVDSEWNHHVAGYLLVAIALLVIASRTSPKLRNLQTLWPLLFVGVALFLAVWSDKEIWPRGFLIWTWLIHHDPEARQHKIYAVLLLVMGIIEYLRWRGKLGQFWKVWAFPLLAGFGACLLLIHDHGGSSGLPPGWDSADKLVKIAGSARTATTGLVLRDLSQSEDATEMNMGNQSMPGMHSPADSGGTSYLSAGPAHQENGHKHIMTSSMRHVEEQHLWFMLVGVAIAVFKFIDDASLWHKRFVPYLWPGAMCVLGTLLILYTETKG